MTPIFKFFLYMLAMVLTLFVIVVWLNGCASGPTAFTMSDSWCAKHHEASHWRCG